MGEVSEGLPAFRLSKPFPHIVIDGLVSPIWLSELLEEWPEKDWKTAERAEGHGFARDKQFHTYRPPAFRKILAYLHSPWFLSQLEKITGIARLKADPKTRSGGLHRVCPGGFLNVHADFNYLEGVGRRRLNLLLYLNKDWKPEYRGFLELWGKDGCEVSISPDFNRAVIFETSDFSFHGHPRPHKAPTSRKSIALYYYDDGEVKEQRSTVYLDGNNNLLRT